MAGVVGALDSGNRYVGGDDGAFHLVPNEATAAANGLDWNDVFWYGSDDTLPGSIGDPLGDASPQPQPQPQPTAPAPAPTADNAAGASSFVWGGRSWSGGDLAAFVGYLAAHGADYSTWAANHPAAAAIFDQPTYPGGQEPVPKSVGQALGAAIAAGATPAEAAASAAALAASQAAQGFGAPTGAALLQAAQQVYDNYVAAGGPPGGTGGGAVNTTPSADPGIDRYLAGDAIALDLADDSPSRTLAGVVELPAKAWQDLRHQLVHTIPYVGTHVRARGKGMRGVVASDLWSGSS